MQTFVTLLVDACLRTSWPARHTCAIQVARSNSLISFATGTAFSPTPFFRIILRSIILADELLWSSMGLSATARSFISQLTNDGSGFLWSIDIALRYNEHLIIFEGFQLFLDPRMGTANILWWQTCPLPTSA